MKLKFFPSLILVILFSGCSLLLQNDEEAPFLADTSRCNVASPLSKEQPNRCAKRQKIDVEVARTAQEQYIAAQQSLMQQQSQQQLEQMQQRQNMRNLQNEQNWNRLRNLENISSGRI